MVEAGRKTNLVSERAGELRGVSASARDGKSTHELVLGGMPFRLRSSHNEQFVRELAEFVDARLQASLAATRSGSFQSAAVLTALNLAEELLLLKRKALAELDRIEERALRIAHHLEQSQIQTKV